MTTLRSVLRMSFLATTTWGLAAPAFADPSAAARETAARTTAAEHPACTAITPFYWEIGDRDGLRISASQGSGEIQADTSMLIASASKWIFGAYVVQKRTDAAGVTRLSESDLKGLRMQSGYSSQNYALCQGTQTVEQCFRASSLLAGANDRYKRIDDGAFTYNSGHFQKLAVDLGLGTKTTGPQTQAGALAQEMLAGLGGGFELAYDSPQPAAGVRTTPADYARFLRKLLHAGEPVSTGLQAGALLGSESVCARYHLLSCPKVHGTPIPDGEQWRYSLGHWVESDPAVGDGAFSSPGAFGFYPWIDASKTWYGLVARQQDLSFTDPRPFKDSVDCGRLIRKAWLTGVTP